MATTKSSSKISPLSTAARNVLEAANVEAKQLGSPAIGSEHLLLGLIADQSDIVAQVLATFYSISFSCSAGTTADTVMAAKIRGHLPSQSPITDPTIKLPMNSEAAAILTQAKKEAETANNKTIDTEHLLSALIKSNTAGKNFLIFFAFNLPAIEKMVQDKKQEAKKIRKFLPAVLDLINAESRCSVSIVLLLAVSASFFACVRIAAASEFMGSFMVGSVMGD
jgi:ATP-dependent Clp protease ATP-binding subunit ClpA